MNIDDTILNELANSIANHPHYSKLNLKSNTSRVKQLIIDFLKEDFMRTLLREEFENMRQKFHNEVESVLVQYVSTTH